MNDRDILDILSRVIHPETGESLTQAGMVKGLSLSGGEIRFSIALKRARDPFGVALKREAVRLITERFPETEGHVTVFIEEPAAKPQPAPKEKRPGTPEGIRKVIAVASGKGGVGKSTVTANLAVALTGQGYRVGVLDADIYGPSQPELFGVAGYQPPVEMIDGHEMILPAVSNGVKVMSIGFFINPADALVWRGPMATNALRQMIHQTLWGPLDFLLIDLPPGTGDVHLTVLQEVKVSGAVIVSTPQQIALADVVRGIAMLRAEKIAVPVLGIVENLAWFTPAELPQNRYYIFGKGGAARLAEELHIELLGRIPLILPAENDLGGGIGWNVDNPELKNIYTSIAQKIASSK